MGAGGVTVLSNGDYVVRSKYDDVSGVSNAGSVKLNSGTTGAEIASLNGDNAGDYMGSMGVTALSNGAFLILSPYFDNNIVVDSGQILIVPGDTP